jgi:hypothetical protein
MSDVPVIGHVDEYLATCMAGELSDEATAPDPLSWNELGDKCLPDP